MEMAERLSTERREKAALRRQLIKIAVPIAIQGVVSTTLGLVDDLMVGFLGEVELAAVGVGTQIFMIHYMLIYGMTSGTATFVAQFYGSNDKKNMRRCIGFSVTAMLAVSTIFFILGNVFTREILSFYTNDPQVLDLAVIYMEDKQSSVYFYSIFSSCTYGLSDFTTDEGSYGGQCSCIYHEYLPKLSFHLWKVWHAYARRSRCCSWNSDCKAHAGFDCYGISILK